MSSSSCIAWAMWQDACRVLRGATRYVKKVKQRARVASQTCQRACARATKTAADNARVQMTHAGLCAAGVFTFATRAVDAGNRAVLAARTADDAKHVALQCTFALCAAQTAVVAAHAAMQRCRVNVWSSSSSSSSTKNDGGDGGTVSSLAPAPQPYWSEAVACVAHGWFVPTPETTCTASVLLLPHRFSRQWFFATQHTPRLPSMAQQQHGVQNRCGCDPGVRTFMTVFCPDECAVYEIGTGDNLALMRHAFAARETNPAVFRTMVRELHFQVASWFSQHFTHVAIPTLGASAEQRRACRDKLGAAVLEDLLLWQHRRFVRVLQRVCAASNVVVLLTDEAYTTRTCSRCGSIAAYVGAATVFQCASCRLSIPRDWNGARGVTLRAFHHHAAPPPCAPDATVESSSVNAAADMAPSGPFRTVPFPMNSTCGTAET